METLQVNRKKIEKLSTVLNNSRIKIFEYLVDEDAGTFELTDSFEVPYSGYVSSAQNLETNTVIDSGFKGLFAEYDKDHELIASYTMNVEKFIYRVYKYNFDGFYFNRKKS